MKPFYAALAALAIFASLACWLGCYLRARRLHRQAPRIRNMPLQVGVSIAIAWLWYAVAMQIAVGGKVSDVVKESVVENRAITAQEMADIERLRSWAAPFGSK